MGESKFKSPFQSGTFKKDGGFPKEMFESVKLSKDDVSGVTLYPRISSKASSSKKSNDNSMEPAGGRAKPIKTNWKAVNEPRRTPGPAKQLGVNSRNCERTLPTVEDGRKRSGNQSAENHMNRSVSSDSSQEYDRGSNDLATDLDLHQLPCGESGKWKYIRMYQERARRREARRRRQGQKERENSRGRKSKKGRSRSKTKKKRKGRSKRRSKSRSKSRKSKTGRKGRSKSGNKRGKSRSRKRGKSSKSRSRRRTASSRRRG